MEWLLLTAIAAGVATSVALLWGFSGCDIVFGLDRGPFKPAAPANLVATPLTTSEIRLGWTPVSLSGVTFEVERTPDGGTPTSVSATLPASPFTDTGLDADTTYFYRVRAIGPDSASDWTGSVSAKTLAVPPVVFEPSFETALPVDDGALGGWCIVQRIEASRLLRSGTQIRLTISGSTNAALSLSRIVVSRVAGSGNAYDSAADLTLVASNVVIAASATPMAMTLPPVAYVLDENQPLLVAVDVSPVNAGFVRHADGVPNTDASAFLGPGSSTTPRQEAGMNARSLGYVPVSRLYLVLKIEVA